MARALGRGWGQSGIRAVLRQAVQQEHGVVSRVWAFAGRQRASCASMLSTALVVVPAEIHALDRRRRRHRLLLRWFRHQVEGSRRGELEGSEPSRRKQAR